MKSCCVSVDIACLNTLKELIETESEKTVLDLSEVSVADYDAATFSCSLRTRGYRAQELPRVSSWLGFQRTGAS